MRERLFKTTKYFLITVLFFCIYSSTQALANPIAKPEISGESAVVIDAQTGQIIYSKNPKNKYFPASTTKVMTAILTLENTNLNDIVTVGKNPPLALGSSIGLKEGEKFTVEDILTGLMLESGNDCALALAEHVAGSKEEFAKMMNAKAAELGCKDTLFTNPSGLPDPMHITTAYDLSLITREAIKYDDFVRISKILTKQLPPSNLDGAKRFVNNHNSLLNPNSSLYYEPTLAAKTGYTDDARHTYTIAAKKNGRTLIASIMKVEDKIKNFKEVPLLLDYAFNTSSNIELYKKDQVVENIQVTQNFKIPLAIQDSFMYTSSDDSPNATPSLKFDLPNDIKNKALKKGDLIAKASIYVNNEKIGDASIVSAIDRPYNSFIKAKEFASNNKGVTLGIFIVILLIVLVIIRLINLRRRKLARRRRWAELVGGKR